MASSRPFQVCTDVVYSFSASTMGSDDAVAIVRDNRGWRRLLDKRGSKRKERTVGRATGIISDARCYKWPSTTGEQGYIEQLTDSFCSRLSET